MEKSKLYEGMTNVYSLSKTLRFELKPQYETLENIKANNIMLNDEKRKKNYLQFKLISDEIFKQIIIEQLSLFKFDLTDLKKFEEALINKEIKQIDILAKKMMKELDNELNKSEKLKKIYGKEIIDLVIEFCKENEEYREFKEVVESFIGFTTYFRDYIENRKNMFDYRTEETSIAFRIINENLPIFINNKVAFNTFFKKINKKEEFKENLKIELQKMNINESIDKLFSLENFNNTLTQTGIEKYNLIISGQVKEDDEVKIKGINELMNLYKQQNKEENVRAIRLQKLRKQILLDSASESFAFDLIEEDEEVTSMIKQYIDSIEVLMFNGDTDMFVLLKNMFNEDFSKLYLENKNITEFSRRVYGDFGYLTSKMREKYISTFEEMGKKINEKNLEKYLKKDYYTFEEIFDVLNEEEMEKFKKYISFSLYKSKLENLDESNYDPKNEFFDRIGELNSEIEKAILTGSDKKLLNNSKAIEAIKNLLDELKDYQSFLANFRVRNTELISDSTFYSYFEYSYNTILLIIPIYNRIRNYLTKKPFSTDKIKLNFDNQQLLAGWSKSKESDCLGTIFLKDGNYYLGLINKDTPKKNMLFEDKQFEEMNTDESFFEKVDVFMLADPKRDFPKKYFSTKGQETFNVPEDILFKYDKYRDDKGAEFQNDRDYHLKLIKFYQEQLEITEEWKVYDFKYKKPEEYENINEFLDEIGRQAYKFNIRQIPESYIRQLVAENKLYLFQIYSKDFAPGRRGKPDLQTLYLKAIFDELNFEKYNYKLSGFAEVFYRPASLERKITHPKGEPIEKKNPNAIGSKESLFDYDLIKDKRYTEDKFFLHIPVEMNRVSDNLEFQINNMIFANIYANQDKTNYVLGIDRGERHLIYLVLINDKGEIVKQETLNCITNKFETKEGQKGEIKTNYHKLLSDKQIERTKSKQDWETIENIKELKAGYLSNVINKILEIMIEYQPIIVFENLNTGFKNSRIKIEKQVYQKFEKALITKLNYIVRKDLEYKELGGLFNPLQLTRPYTEKYKGKQNGILFYVPASYTSNIDPVTGFMPFIYTRYENIEKTKKLIELFDDISYLENEDIFRFVADYSKFKPEAKYWDRKVWDIYTNGTRIKTYRSKEHNQNWVSEEVTLVDEFKKLFYKFNINYRDNLKKQMLEQEDKEFFETLLYLIRLTQQLRNSVTGEDIDYIISPIKNKKGNFFDSRASNSTLPKNADANGAYNIARKGLMVLDNIKAGVVQKEICNISFEEWFKFVENQDK